ncbi:tyrosine-type recombinase/integrase [Nonomuraea sp. NPDC050540]|uniref:tyrosine-type recombinase/integrase n=1 Tax=Nonomuraea sp. NPDC050540 TaxID=3364367 RepID=UPI0037B8377D
MTKPQAVALAWLQRASLPVRSLWDATELRRALAALSVNLDGRPAAANTVKRRRAILHQLLEWAVEQQLFTFNPLDRIKWTPPRTNPAVDPRVVVNPAQAVLLLDCVALVGRERGARMRALFATMYYAGLRPEEVAALRKDNCHLPEHGWGLLILDGSRPQSGSRWTDSGETSEPRSLKHRASKATRQVPIPLALVHILREHMHAYGTAKDGRLFCTPTGKPYTPSALSRVWAEARRAALTSEQQASPLAARPYDLRHAAVSLWLNAGVAPAEVAERAGHGVDVLLKVYAHCLDGDLHIHNTKIEHALEWCPRQDSNLRHPL